MPVSGVKVLTQPARRAWVVVEPAPAGLLRRVGAKSPRVAPGLRWGELPWLLGGQAPRATRTFRLAAPLLRAGARPTRVARSQIRAERLG